MTFFKDLRSVHLQEAAKKAQELAVNGRHGTATIIDIRNTGTFVNEDPEVEMDLQVSVEGMRPYPATHRQVVARVAARQFHAGATVPVRSDPMQPTSLIVA